MEATRLQKKLDRAVGIDIILDNLLACARRIIQQEQKETTMTSKVEPHFIVEDIDNTSRYDTKAEALDAAKRRVACSHRDTYVVYQALTVVNAPVPDAIVSEIA